MRVELTIHTERVGDELIWWAESPDVLGFSASANSLEELRALAETVLEEILGDTVELTV